MKGANTFLPSSTMLLISFSLSKINSCRKLKWTLVLTIAMRVPTSELQFLQKINYLTVNFKSRAHKPIYTTINISRKSEAVCDLDTGSIERFSAVNPLKTQTERNRYLRYTTKTGYTALRKKESLSKGTIFASFQLV
jgi:hypothetical protein